jgi:outer membrane protein OmpA-like peptidoglycan-associated protein
MISMGVSANVIRIAGHGESNPASNNSNSKGRALNRRAIVSTGGE